MKVSDSFDEKELAAAWGVPAKDPQYSDTLSRLRVLNRYGNAVRTSTLGYLGYGCIERGKLVRSAIAPGSKVTLRILGGSRNALRLSNEAAQLAEHAL